MTSQTYSATYVDAGGQSYTAVIFLSSVTLSIRFTDAAYQQQDVHWLAQNIQSLEEKGTGWELCYRNKEGLTERLLVRDAALLQAIKNSFRYHKFTGKGHYRIMGSTWSVLLIISGIMVGLIALAYFWFIPWLGERVGMQVSKAYEIKVGDQLYQSMESSFAIDAVKTKAVNTFYQQLGYNTGYPVQITVVKSNQVNAFAIPGGHIVVYDAILESMKTPEELAALLGHEGSHIALRHSLRSLFRNLARKMFISLLVGSESGMAAVLVNNADELKGLQYSRALETEADDNGMKLMADNHIDPQGMLRLMQLLQKETKGPEPAAFLATHPVFETRMANIREQLNKYPTPATGNDTLKKLFHAIYE